MAGLSEQGRKTALCELGLPMNTDTHTQTLAQGRAGSLGIWGYKSSSRVQAG